MTTTAKRMGRPPLPRHTKLGRRLLALRERLDMTQPELAKKLGVSTMSVRRWERGTEEPAKSRMILIDLLENDKF